MGLTIGVDVGGTKVAAGVVDEGGQILTRVRRSTPAADAARLVEEILAAIEELRGQHEVEAVGMAAAGFVDASRSVVLFAPNISWRNEPLRQRVERQTGLAATVENDANAAAWGEYRFGGGRGDDVVCVTIGTGVGGGVVLDGHLLRGHWGMAGEIGHVRVEHNGRPCGCGSRGCLEQYASGQALVREARWRAAEDRPGAGLLLSLGDGTPEGVQGAHVSEAARAGDPVALASFEAVGRWLGVGLADVAAVLDPAAFVIGGGVSEAGEQLLAPTRASFAEALTAAAHRPLAEIRLAELGNDAGLIGAADLARR